MHMRSRRSMESTLKYTKIKRYKVNNNRPDILAICNINKREEVSLNCSVKIKSNQIKFEKYTQKYLNSES